jgi:predicted nucleic-acid-binding protein
MISLIDTNVLVRFFTNDRGEKYKTLYQFFDALEGGKIRIRLELIVLFQTAFVLKSYYEVSKQDIAIVLMDLLKFKGIQIRDKKKVIRTLELWHEKNLEIVDCYLVACLENDQQNILYSYDRDFDKFQFQRKEP